MIPLFCCMFFLLSPASAYSTTADEYKSTISAILDNYAVLTNSPYQFSVRHKDLNYTYAAGVENHETSAPLTTKSLIPLGSVTKAYTVMGMMRLIEQGVVGFNDTISEHVDDILMKSNGTTLSQIWNNDPLLEEVTIYRLMHMKGGLNDYDDSAMLEWTLAHPDQDFTPLDYVHNLNKTWVCAPGSCQYYSSVGISLLAFALAQHSGANSWQEYDQFEMFPEGLRQEYFNNTMWMKEGKCSKYGNVTQQYMQTSRNEFPGEEFYYENLYDFSCLNGWGFGNIAATVDDVAKFFYQYLGTEDLIKKETLAKMMNWEAGGGTDGFKFVYGLGFMPNVYPVMAGQDTDFHKRAIIGHAGLDWGSYADLAGYNQFYNFSIVNGQNTDFGWDCAQGTKFQAFGYTIGDTVDCLLVNQTMQYFSNGTAPHLDCSDVDKFELGHNFRAARRAARAASKPELKTTGNAVNESNFICQPYCGLCTYGSCASCKECINSRDGRCAHCFLPQADNSSQPCLSHTMDRCEKCWFPNHEIEQSEFLS